MLTDDGRQPSRSSSTTSSRWTQEEESLSLIRSTVIISGIALTLFVVGIGVLVTRLVVDPVRRAAGTAQRLAEGQLEQRMTVRGEDDLARLATSFNAMADSLQRQITQLEGLSQLQQRFTSDVSHELRTPLTTVQMAADVLHEARGDFPPARRPVRGAAARGAGPVRGRCSPTCWRSAATTPGPPSWTPSRPTSARWSPAWPPGCTSLAELHECELVVDRPDEDDHRRGRRPARGADPAQPGRQRHRARRRSARSRSPSPRTGRPPR